MKREVGGFVSRTWRGFGFLYTSINTSSMVKKRKIISVSLLFPRSFEIALVDLPSKIFADLEKVALLLLPTLRGLLEDGVLRVKKYFLTNFQSKRPIDKRTSPLLMLGKASESYSHLSI